MRRLGARALSSPGSHAGLVGIVVFVGLTLHRRAGDATWTPRGADWDTWLQSILAVTQGIAYPPERWPLQALVTAPVALLVPGATFVDAQLVSIGMIALAVAGVFHLGRRLMNPAAGLAAAALAATFAPVVETSTWISAYTTWTAATVWAIVGLVEGVRTGRLVWWAVAGLAVAAAMAAVEKGLAIGLASGAVALGALLLAPRALPRRLGAFALPFAALVLAYVVFPSPLTTLESRVYDFEAVSGGTAPAPRSARSSFEGGYVFGRSMGPRTIARTLSGLATQYGGDVREQRGRESLATLRKAFPSVGGGFVAWLAAGLGMGVVAGVGAWVRRGAPEVLVGWAGVAAVGVALWPSLSALLNLRYVLPAFVLAPLLLVAPVALFPGVVGGRWRLASLALVPLALLPSSPWQASPWLHGAEVLAWEQALLVPGSMGVRIRADLARDLPGVPVYVDGPPSFVVVLDGRPGELLFRDPRFHTGLLPVAPDDAYVLRWSRRRPEVGVTMVGGRPAVRIWVDADNGAALLLGPVGDPPPAAPIR